MNLDFHTLFTLPPLLIIGITSFFGLADVRPVGHANEFRTLCFDFMLGVCFLAMAVGALFLALAVLGGTHVVKWPGIILLYGVSGVFSMIGHYAPWRLWIKRVRP